MFGSMLIGEKEQRTNITLIKIDDCEFILKLSVLITTLKMLFLQDGC